MAYQAKESWCCPSALQSALEIHGVRVGQSGLADLLGTDQDGTDETDLIRALDVLGCQWHELDTDDRGTAREWLTRFAPVAPLLLCVDSYNHWVTVAGVCGPRMWLLDPSPEPYNLAGLGRWALTTGGVLKRWRAGQHVGPGGKFYGIALLSCDSAQARTRTGPAG